MSGSLLHVRSHSRRDCLGIILLSAWGLLERTNQLGILRSYAQQGRTGEVGRQRQTTARAILIGTDWQSLHR